MDAVVIVAQNLLSVFAGCNRVFILIGHRYLGRVQGQAVMGPDGELYVTTSNCDGRGRCPPELDKILRITR